MLRRHESFTAGAAPPPPLSRFRRPYFVADVPGGGGGDDAGSSDNSNSSSSPSSSAASDQQQQAAVKLAVENEAAAPNGMGVAVDVELISDSSDDDSMSLPGDDAAGAGSLIMNNPRDEDEDPFEVESITQQVAAGTYVPASSGSSDLLPMLAQTDGCAAERQQQPPRDVNVMRGQEEEDASISVSSCSNSKSGWRPLRWRRARRGSTTTSRALLPSPATTTPPRPLQQQWSQRQSHHGQQQQRRHRPQRRQRHHGRHQRSRAASPRRPPRRLSSASSENNDCFSLPLLTSLSLTLPLPLSPSSLYLYTNNQSNSQRKKKGIQDSDSYLKACNAVGLHPKKAIPCFTS